jgi:hypothetical protein
MGVTAFKMKVEYIPLRYVDSRELFALIDKVLEPFGEWGDEPIYVVDVERLDEILADKTLHLTPRERQMLEALKQEADKEGGAFDLTFG